MRKGKNIKVMLSIVLVLVLAIVWRMVSIYREVSKEVADEFKEAVELKVSDIAPGFEVTLLSGETFTLSKHKGKVVFLNFWATWCSPCVAEMPAIQKLSEQYREDVVFIGIDMGESKDKVQDFITNKGYTYNIGLDEEAKISRRLYPTDGIPYTLIIDAEGVISKIFLGGGDQMLKHFEEAIKSALKR